MVFRQKKALPIIFFYFDILLIFKNVIFHFNLSIYFCLKVIQFSRIIVVFTMVETKYIVGMEFSFSIVLRALHLQLLQYDLDILSLNMVKQIVRNY